MLKSELFQLPITIKQVIDSVNDGSLKGMSFCVYAKKTLGSLSSDQECFLDAYPEGDEEGEDVFSVFVTKNKLELIYYGEQLEDVLTNVLNQRPQATTVDFVNALNYYMKNDNFMDF
jgi:hypothetical protein